MLYDLTSPDKQTVDEIAAKIGKSFTLLERIKMRGNGSQKLQIVEASEEIRDLAVDTHGLSHCNIEVRENGLLVHFRARARSMAWVLPYWQLNVYLGAGKLSLYGNKYFMRLADPYGNNIQRSFVQKLYELIARSTGQDDDIYGSIP